MLDGAMKMSFHTLHSPPVLLGLVTKNRAYFGARRIRSPNHHHLPSLTVQVSSVLVQTDESGNLPEPIKVLSSGVVNQRPRCTQTSDQLLSQPNTIGIIGGVSAFSTLIFLEKLVWWGIRAGGCPPFVVCSDSSLRMKLPILNSFHSFNAHMVQIPSSKFGPVVESLRQKRLAVYGWYISREAADEGFEVVLPDRATMEHVVIPAVEAVKRGDKKRSSESHENSSTDSIDESCKYCGNRL
ncbi:hypothetical protein F8388_004600 [Cannabis sativa]|uniref:Uncharacterized protein n=1 Tax=Cannabis sativa TaxID=3483 RepID=A0A7J6GNB1_CANSA|nr:hypothetical protein F8388_004600 [Cannabis sativa]